MMNPILKSSMINLSITFVDENDTPLNVPLIIISDYPYIPRRKDFLKFDVKNEGFKPFEKLELDEEYEDLFAVFNSEIFEIMSVTFPYSANVTYREHTLIELVLKNTAKINRQFYNKMFLRNNIS